MELYDEYIEMKRRVGGFDSILMDELIDFMY
jgi:hypothetical protein